MDPNQITSANSPTTSSNRKKLLLFFIVGIVGAIALLFYFSPFVRKLVPIPNTLVKNQPQGAVAKVGEEIIYQADVDKETSLYSPATPSADVNWQQIALSKLVSESVILQGAKADGLINLTPLIFNSRTIDFFQRSKTVEKLTQTIDSRADTLNVSVAGIWFDDKDKEKAYAKILPLYTSVKSKKTAIEQAIETIKKDTSLAQIDDQYQSHAGATFTIQRGQSATFDPDFDTLLWQLKAGEVTDLYLTKLNTVDNKEAYLFATVNKKTSTGKITSFNDWLNQKKKIYEVTYY